MKTLYVFCVIFLVAISCDSNNNSISNEEEAEIFWNVLALEKQDITDVEVASNGMIFAIRNSNSLISSLDGGLSWEELLVFNSNRLYRTWDIFTVGANDELYVAGLNTVYISKDYGRSWKTKSGFSVNVSDTSEALIALTSIAESKNGTLFIGGDGAAFTLSSKTLDFQKLLLEKDLQPNVSAFLSLPTREIIALSTKHDVFYFSDNEGEKWLKSDGLVNQSIGILIEDRRGYLLGGGDGEIIMSGDNGNSWVTILKSSDFNLEVFTDILVDDKNLIYISSLSQGIRVSKNNGDTWFELNQGLGGSHQISALTLDQNGYLIAASRDNGLFISSEPIQ